MPICLEVALRFACKSCVRVCTSPTDTLLEADVASTERLCDDSACLLSSRRKSEEDEALKFPFTLTEAPPKKLCITPLVPPVVAKSDSEDDFEIKKIENK